MRVCVYKKNTGWAADEVVTGEPTFLDTLRHTMFKAEFELSRAGCRDTRQKKKANSWVKLRRCTAPVSNNKGKILDFVVLYHPE